MEFIKTSLEGAFLIKPRIFEDERGFFMETYQKELFLKNGIREDFVQDNHSFSHKNVLRGLHFQTGEFAQGKLVRVAKGTVIDVIVDIRINSATYGKHEKFEISADNNHILYVPTGFAHGFVCLEDAIFMYKCTNLYHKASEGGLVWNDVDLGIDWGVKNPIVSEKDQILGNFKNL